MIIGNTLSEIGDVLYINTTMSLLTNYVNLNTYQDITVGETAARFFNKKFRVSQNGIAYTDWLDLNNTNVNSIEGNVYNNTIYIQYRYERSGTDTTGILEFTSVTLLGTATVQNNLDTVISKTIFNGLSVGNFQTMQLATNLLKKLFKKGIIPEYVERETEDDIDYINYWSTIATYLSMFVTYINNFENMYVQRDVLIEYLKQHNLYINDKNETLEDLQYLVENLFNEFRKRGTKQIFLRKGDINSDTTIVKINGEVLRLLCVETCDEFLFSIKKPGICISKTSLLCKSTRNDEMLIKRFETTDKVTDLSKYTLFGSTYISIEDEKIKIITQGGSTFTGIGYVDINNSILTNGLLVTPYLDYELFFKFKASTNHSSASITVRADAFDCYSNKYTLTDNVGNITNGFIDDFHIPLANTVYTFKGHIRSINETFTNQLITKSTNLSPAPYSTNLRFNNPNITKIAPLIHVKSSNNTIFHVWDIQLRLLKHNKSLGFLNTQSIMEIFAKNNSRLEKLDVYQKIRQDLIPYSINFDDRNLNLYN